MLSAFCRPEEICQRSRNSWESQIPRLSGATSAFATSNGERRQEPKLFLKGKPGLQGRSGEARAHVGRREEEDKLECSARGNVTLENHFF